jgi:hypothetical protein
MAPVGDVHQTSVALAKEHTAAITRDYISQPRISMSLSICLVFSCDLPLDFVKFTVFFN